jgi:hypothetical protein
MSKEFVIEIRIPMPDNIRDQAKVFARFDESVENFKEDLHTKLGDGFSFKEDTVTKRAPRKADAAKPGRKPRAAASVNGAGEGVTA